jgi:hypothetical protein
LLREVRSFLDSRQWDLIPDRHEQLCHLLIEIRGLAPGLSVEERDVLTMILREIGKVNRRVRTRNGPDLDSAVVTDLTSNLQKQLNRLSEVSVRLHQLQGDRQ